MEYRVLLNSDSSAAEGAKIRISDGSDTRPIKFVRITNSPGYCSESPAGSGNYPMVIPATADTTELFGGSGREYALYNMSLRELARSDQRGIYQLSYTLGTNERDTTELVPDANGTYVRCKTDDNVAANFNYCSVSDFDTLIRIGGVGNTMSRQIEQGAAALIVVIFSVLLLITVSLGFMRLVATDQQRTINDELARGAYDAAIAGVEDGKRVLQACMSSRSAAACTAIADNRCNCTGLNYPQC